MLCFDVSAHLLNQSTTYLCTPAGSRVLRERLKGSLGTSDHAQRAAPADVLDAFLEVLLHFKRSTRAGRSDPMPAAELQGIPIPTLMAVPKAR